MTMTEYQNVATAPPTAVAEPGTTWTPNRAPTMESDVFVPLAQATVSALVLTFALTMLAWGTQDVPPWPFAGVCFAVTLAVAWFIAIFDWQKTIWRIEERHGMDLDHDGHQGKPPPARLLEVYSAPPATAQPADPDTAELRARLIEFVRGCELDTTERTWEPRIGRAQWNDYREMLLKLGYAVEDRPGVRNSAWRLKHSAQDTIGMLFGLPRPTLKREG